MADEDHNTISSSNMIKQVNSITGRRNSVYDNLSSSDICDMFNKFLIEFEQMERSDHTTINIFLDAVEKTADAVLSIVPSKLLEPRILYHPLMFFLQQMLTDLLENWQASHLRLNIQETDIFLKIVLTFVHAAEQASTPDNDENRKKIRNLLATKSFLSLVREQIHDNTKYKDGINDDPNICTLGLLTIKLLQGCPFYYNIEQNQCLIDDLVINCIDSYDYIHAVHQLQKGELLTDIDRFLLFTCWEYIPFLSTNSRSPTIRSHFIDLIQHIYDQLLTRLEHALDEPPPIARRALVYILERCYQLLIIPNLRSFDKHAHHIINHLTNILQNSSSTNAHNDEIISIALQAFYNLAQNSDIRSIIRKYNLISFFNKYTSTHLSHKTRQLALGILAQIMNEQEINNNSTEITAFFLDQIKQLHPNQYSPHLDNALSSLKVLMQHEQIKNEFVKQGGLDILIRFIRDGDPNKQSAKQIEDALKILWSCTFNNSQVLNTLQQDIKLMTHVKQLFDHANQNENSSLKKAAEGLIWKVEKEEKFEQEQQEKKRKVKQIGIEGQDDDDEEEEEQYDCMISYSWADMELAHRIFHHLTETFGYRVWLDQEQMHGSTIESMANAVENAEFILMCMSETYKQSANCQSEAEYAFNRKKHIIPIKMKEDYKADGWLGFILGTRMYIDFEKHGFEKAMVLLDNEIQLQKKKRKEAKELAKTERKVAKTDENQIDVEDKMSNQQVVVREMVNVENVVNWNQRNVREFLLKNGLIAMVPICDGINGEELFNLYTMCKMNSATIYRSLKFELLHGHHRILPISTFLRFIRHMRIVCNEQLFSNAHTIKKTLNNHLSNGG